jgi:hypothetical protein
MYGLAAVQVPDFIHKSGCEKSTGAGKAENPGELKIAEPFGGKLPARLLCRVID